MNKSGGFHQRGVTLVELLIALLMSAIVGSALMALFAQTINSRTQIDRAGKKLENGRIALDILANDVRLAGFYGELYPGGDKRSTRNQEITYTVPDPFASLTAANLGWDDTTTPPRIPVPIFGYEAHRAALASSVTTNLPNYRAGTDVLVVRRVSTQTGFSPAGYPTNWTLQARVCGDGNESRLFQIGTTSGAMNFKGSDCLKPASTSLAPMHALVVRIYYVANCDICGSDTIPTLKVIDRTLDTTVRSVAQGVENMHIEYGVDSLSDAGGGTDGTAIDPDGSADIYAIPTNSPATNITGGNAGGNVFFNATADAGTAVGLANYVAPAPLPTVNLVMDWRDVVSVRVSLLVRDANATTGYTDTKQYKLGSHADFTVGAFNDGFKRRIFTQVVRLTNPAGRREAAWVKP